MICEPCWYYRQYTRDPILRRKNSRWGDRAMPLSSDGRDISYRGIALDIDVKHIVDVRKKKEALNFFWINAFSGRTVPRFPLPIFIQVLFGARDVFYSNSANIAGSQGPIDVLFSYQLHSYLFRSGSKYDLHCTSFARVRFPWTPSGECG